MAYPLHASRLRTLGIHNLGGRNYDYTQMYNPDKLGEEVKVNARVWYVYLDEAGSHDADMIEGFQSILESLLVFAALFSAVVTTFVAQTSQVLQPDNAQIMVSLLVETNQLLRAVGNGSSINAVPAATLGPESRTHTSKDVWVNGLFFTSLALSLSTALLSVLAKQWIQAYTATVSGDAQTRASIRQFRVEGLEKWKLSTIIEILPLILHCSVAVFLVGLALYVSQLSRPIGGIVAGITAVTFFFYFVSSVLPAFYLACPYRIPFIFLLVRLLIFAFGEMKWNCSRLWYMLTHNFDRDFQRPPWQQSMSRQPLKEAEHDAVWEQTYFDHHLSYNSLDWVFNHSSNRFVKDIVIEGTCGLLDEWSSLKERDSYRLPSEYLNPSSGNNHLLSAVEYSLSRLLDTYSAFSTEDEIGNNTYGRLIKTFMTTLDLKTLLDEATAGFKDWQEKIRLALSRAYALALRDRNRVLSRWLLDLGGPNLFQSGIEWDMEFLRPCARVGDAEDFRELVHRGIDLTCRDSSGETALHRAALAGNLEVVNFLVEREPALISARSHSGFTALDDAILRGNSDILVYLLDHGAQVSSYASWIFGFYMEPERVALLLDRGWDRTVKDANGETLLEVARSKGDVRLVEYLEHYQTVRLAPYGMTSHTVNAEIP